LNGLLKKCSDGFKDGKVCFINAGYYKVTDTIFVPPNCRIVGEIFATVIMGSGDKFSDIDKPYPVIQVGKDGDVGYIEWSDTIVSTQGAAAGAKLIEYNLDTPAECLEDNPPSGM
jgi:glucan 1,3-beta-glucosidase